MKRFTILLDVGSAKSGELAYETPAGYMRNLGAATLSRDGWVAWGNGLASNLPPEVVRVVAQPAPSLTDRVIAQVLARIPAAMERAKLLADRAHDAPILSAERDTRVSEVA